MTDRVAIPPPPARPGPRPWLDGFCRRRVLATLAALREGRLVIEEEGRPPLALGSTTDDGAPPHRIVVHDPAFWRALALRGALGAGEGYVHGFWSSPDLTGLLRLLVRSMRTVRRLESPLVGLATLTDRLAHALRRNTLAGSRRNIEAHYDLGDDFYALFLDETWAYSCALFRDPAMTLADASRAKFDAICRKLALEEAHHVIEVGCGWGGFALHAAERYGCRVTATTISPSQARRARARVAEAGLGDRIEIVENDYRHLNGTFDRLVSIEMVEAVGAENLPVFLGCCGRLLAPDGLMALQAITIPDDRFRRHVRTVDFIKRWIFPGSCIPSTTALLDAATAASDLRLVDLEDLTPHYATTLAAWRERFLARAAEATAMGVTDEFRRLWVWYLTSCEASFAERYNGDVQMIFARPEARHSRVRRCRSKLMVPPSGGTRE